MKHPLFLWRTRLSAGVVFAVFALFAFLPAGKADRVVRRQYHRSTSPVRGGFYDDPWGGSYRPVVIRVSAPPDESEEARKRREKSDREALNAQQRANEARSRDASVIGELRVHAESLRSRWIELGRQLAAPPYEGIVDPAGTNLLRSAAQAARQVAKALEDAETGLAGTMSADGRAAAISALRAASSLLNDRLKAVESFRKRLDGRIGEERIADSRARLRSVRLRLSEIERKLSVDSDEGIIRLSRKLSDSLFDAESSIAQAESLIRYSTGDGDSPK